MFTFTLTLKILLGSSGFAWILLDSSRAKSLRTTARPATRGGSLVNVVNTVNANLKRQMHGLGQFRSMNMVCHVYGFVLQCKEKAYKTHPTLLHNWAHRVLRGSKRDPDDAVTEVISFMHIFCAAYNLLPAGNFSGINRSPASQQCSKDLKGNSN